MSLLFRKGTSALGVLISFSVFAQAQTPRAQPARSGTGNVISTTIDVMTGGTNQARGAPGTSGSATGPAGPSTSTDNKPFFFFYGAYPSITLTSKGAHSLLT